jgi:hypothetical protein
VLAILFCIYGIVDQVNAARQEAEDDERRQSPDNRPSIPKALPERDRREDEHVLRPLPRAHRFEKRNEHSLLPP